MSTASRIGFPSKSSNRNVTRTSDAGFAVTLRKLTHSRTVASVLKNTEDSVSRTGAAALMNFTGTVLSNSAPAATGLSSNATSAKADAT